MLRVALPLLLVAAANAAFGAAVEPREEVPAWLGLLAASAAALALAARALLQRGPSRRFVERVALVGAAALALSCLTAPVSLSDDVERYVWDGHLVATGRDPFAHRPRELVGADPFLDEARLGRLNSPDYFSVYPPLAQGAFGLAAALERARLLGAVLALRVLFGLAGLAAVLALVRVARRRKVPVGWVLAFAWHPMLWWELVAGVHTEALLLAPLLLAVDAALAGRAARAGLLLGLAAAAKLTALLLGPGLLVLLWRRARWRALALALAPVLLTLSFAPFAGLDRLAHLRESLSLFTEAFSFNAPVYYAARDALGYVRGLTPSVDAQVLPWLQAGALGWLAAMAWRREDAPGGPWRSLAYAYLGYLLLSRVLHPWYALPAMALGALGQSRAALWLGLASALSYLRYDPFVGERAWVLALEVVPFAALAARELVAPPSRAAPDGIAE